MNKQRVIMSGVTILLVVLAAAWAMGYLSGDPAVAELQQLRDQMRDASDTERQQLRDQFRERMGNLTDAQRDVFRQAGRGQWQQFAQQRMDEFFALPQAEQKQRLDEMINRMVARQNERERNPQVGNRGDRGNRGGGRNMTEGQRDQRRKERIARTDPKSRAQFDQFRRMLNDRRQERGLPATGGGGRWRGGFGGGTF